MQLASLFNPKARKWVEGRKNIFQKMGAAITPADRVIWMHCASLGEFEQGRPLLESLKKTYPSHRILLTFFSPSGYEVQKNYSGADWIFYLPLDGPGRAKRFIEIAHPELVIFVKYEFWFFYLKKLSYRNTPLLLVAALFRKDMSFFSWYGWLSRKMASRFDQLFVQNESSKQLLEKIGLGKIVTVAGDTRFDRVLTIANQAKPIDWVPVFAQEQPLLIAGSTWPNDETLLANLMKEPRIKAFKLVIAPHEINEAHLDSLAKLFPSSVRLSAAKKESIQQFDVLIIDGYGLLSSLYQYATLAYVGGGWQPSGVHNVLEAAVYGVPVLFGPAYQKYAEAIGLVQSGGGIPLQQIHESGNELSALLTKLLLHQEQREQKGKAAFNYVNEHKGATDKIMNYIQENRLLIN
jgi:3-deoxy-D-manno-octulosonic-acid transferase